MWRGVSRVWLGSSSRAVRSWASPIRRAKRPAGATRVAAVGTIWSKCSTARRVTTSNEAVGKDSARAVCILMSVNIRVRAISRRKVDFL